VAQAPKPDDTQPIVALSEDFLPPPAQSGGADAVRLEMRVEELERRLKARTLELETEIRGKERLRTRMEELTRRIAELEETAACLHREAVSATALSQELDETLRVASEARRHLAAALEAERGRREGAEKDLGLARPALEETRAALSRVEAEAAEKLRAAAQAVEGAVAHALKKHEGELRDAKRMVQAARQKIDGHEAHIDSLRAEVADACQRQLESEKVRAELESRALAAEEKARSLIENAEAIRREGVEAFEKAREAGLALQLKEDKLRREGAGLEALKADIRARAEREMTEMRRTLDAERARMQLDLEAERLGAAALGRTGEAPAERFDRLHAESEERRREIAREARQSIAPAPSAPKRPPLAASDVEPPTSREPWQVTDEIRLLLGVAIVVVIVAAMIASVLFLQN